MKIRSLLLEVSRPVVRYEWLETTYRQLPTKLKEFVPLHVKEWRAFQKQLDEMWRLYEQLRDRELDHDEMKEMLKNQDPRRANAHQLVVDHVLKKTGTQYKHSIFEVLADKTDTLSKWFFHGGIDLEQIGRMIRMIQEELVDVHKEIQSTASDDGSVTLTHLADLTATVIKKCNDNNVKLVKTKEVAHITELGSKPIKLQAELNVKLRAFLSGYEGSRDELGHLVSTWSPTVTGRLGLTIHSTYEKYDLILDKVKVFLERKSKDLKVAVTITTPGIEPGQWDYTAFHQNQNNEATWKHGTLMSDADKVALETIRFLKTLQALFKQHDVTFKSAFQAADDYRYNSHKTTIKRVHHDVVIYGIAPIQDHHDRRPPTTEPHIIYIDPTQVAKQLGIEVNHDGWQEQESWLLKTD